MPSTQPARGMRDFLPDDVRRREFVMGVIASVYERYGFEPLETPAVENLETLLGKYGEEGDTLIFKILKRGEHEGSGQADLALRYDLTVPLARVVAEHRAKLPKFFKRYQIQPVWRADRPQRGRFREFYQCDVDAIGSTSPLVEADLCAAASEALVTLGFDRFAIRLNHRQLLTGLLDSSGVPAALHGEALVALDKLDKIGRDGVASELLARQVPAEAAQGLLEVFSRFGSADAGAAVARPADVVPGAYADVVPGLGLEPLRATDPANYERLRLLGCYAFPNEAALAAVRVLARIVSLCAPGPAGPHLQIDPSLARGLSYYTGAIMEIAVPDLAGSLGGGGRYDNLVGMFLGQDVPACGFSLGLERIIVVMTERGMFPPGVHARPADIMVTLWNADAANASLALAGELRRAGLRAEVYPEPDKLGKQFKYASGRGVPLVAVLGDDEMAAGTVAVKDLRSGEQAPVAREDVAAFVRARI
jgi:histidyl-tRNA synthetase